MCPGQAGKRQGRDRRRGLREILNLFNAVLRISMTYGQVREMVRHEDLSERTGLMSTSRIRTARGSATATRIPTAYCANICPREKISAATRSYNLTASRQASLDNQESRWAGKRLLKPSCQKAPSTSENVGLHKTRSTVLHLELGSDLILVC
jgi:hypothetical protein